MNLTQHFTLEEMSHSDYAEAHGIKKLPRAAGSTESNDVVRFDLRATPHGHRPTD